ncbi:DUF6542 domain-containing protein [Pseudonocardia sichuanensis]
MTEPAGERSPRRRGGGSTGGRPQDRGGRPDGGTPPRRATPPASGGDPERRAGGRGGTARPGGKSTTAAGRKGAEPKVADRKERARRNAAEKKTADKAAARTERADREPPVRGAGGHWPMADRSVLATVLGLPPVAAVGLAAALTAVGVLVDLTQVGGLGIVFTVCHISGCVLAVAWVRRTGLFGPMVQPPLLVALSVPVVVLLSGTPRPGQGVAERLLVIGAPLVNAFPVMAWTTGIVLVAGALRIVLQRPVDAGVSASGRAAAPGAGRTSASPRRS